MKNVLSKFTLLFLISMSVILSACTKSSSSEKEEEDTSISTKGKLSKMTISSNNGYKTIYSFSYGDNGYVSEYTRSTGKDETYNERKYKLNYDSSDKITSIIQAENSLELKYNTKNQVSEYNNLRYEYNSTGKISKVYIINPESLYADLQYSGNNITRREYSYSDKENAYEEVKYDDKINPIKGIFPASYEKTLIDLTFNGFNSSDNNIVEYTYDPGSVGLDTQNGSYEYNEKNYPTKLIVGSGSYMKETEYEYYK